MRLSMDKDDPGYDPARGIHAKVLLDGVEVKDCVTADEELGKVWVIYEPAFSAGPWLTKVPTVERSGKVQIILNGIAAP
jgi:hypothetical protein